MAINTKSCWICGLPSDCAEHIHKKTDVVTLFGKGPYQRGKRLTKTSLTSSSNSSRPTIIQSEDSDFLKFDKNVCKHCNGARTQPYDNAYKSFIEYIHKNSNIIFKTKKLSLDNVYRKNQKLERVYLCKYFMKLFGCVLADNNIAVPDELVFSVLHKNHNIPKLFFLKFSLCDYFPDKKKGLHSLLLSHDLIIEKRDLGNISSECITWSQAISWLAIEYYFFKANKITKKPLRGIEPTPWNGKDKYIKLGIFSDTPS